MKTNVKDQDVREIKVCKKWNGNKPVPSVSLQGLYLNEYNFNVGDNVRVICYRDEIRIVKITQETLLKRMQIQNPALAKLVSEFECELCI